MIHFFFSCFHAPFPFKIPTRKKYKIPGLLCPMVAIPGFISMPLKTFLEFDQKSLTALVHNDKSLLQSPIRREKYDKVRTPH